MGHSRAEIMKVRKVRVDRKSMSPKDEGQGNWARETQMS